MLHKIHKMGQEKVNQTSKPKLLYINLTNKKIRTLQNNDSNSATSKKCEIFRDTISCRTTMETLHKEMKKVGPNIKYKQNHWLVGKYSKLSIHNKILVYEQILKLE